MRVAPVGNSNTDRRPAPRTARQGRRRCRWSGRRRSGSARQSALDEAAPSWMRGARARKHYEDEPGPPRVRGGRCCAATLLGIEHHHPTASASARVAAKLPLAHLEAQVGTVTGGVPGFQRIRNADTVSLCKHLLDGAAEARPGGVWAVVRTVCSDSSSGRLSHHSTVAIAQAFVAVADWETHVLLLCVQHQENRGRAIDCRRHRAL